MGWSFLILFATYDTNGTDILIRSFDITSSVHGFFNECLPLSLDRFSLVLLLGVNVF